MMKKIILITLFNILLLTTFISTINSESSIHGGTISPYKSFMATVKTNKTFCSGVLVHPRIILSDSACYNGGPVTIGIGQYDKSNHDNNEFSVQTETFTVTENGLLLLLLPYDVRSLMPITVATYISNDDVSLYGWGIVNNHNLPDKLQTAKQKIIFVLDGVTICYKDIDGESRGSPGDSGGAATQMFNGEEKIISIIDRLLVIDGVLYTCGTSVYDVRKTINHFLSENPVYYSYFPQINN